MYLCLSLLCICDPAVFVYASILRLSLRMISHENNKKDLPPMTKVARKCLGGNIEKQV